MYASKYFNPAGRLPSAMPPTWLQPPVLALAVRVPSGRKPGIAAGLSAALAACLALAAPPACGGQDPDVPVTGAAPADFYPADPLRSLRGTAAGPAGAAPCMAEAPPAPLELAEAASRALCANPKTRLAWSNLRYQAAQLGEARAAWLPVVGASASLARDHDRSSVPAAPLYNTDNRSHYKTVGMRLTWLLFDFGARSAGERQARSMLEAAGSAHDAAIQQVLLATARDYYSVLSAQGVLSASEDMERTARASLDAATALAKGGAVPATDVLQARTAHAQAVYNAARARGELQVALGALALDMGLAPSTPLQVAAPAQDVDAAAPSLEAVQALLDDAQYGHPSLLAARAQLDAARARADQARAQGRPTLSLSGSAGGNNRPVKPSLGSPGYPASGRDRRIGLELNIPLFDGLNRTYQVRQAEAQAQGQEAQLADAEQQVAQQVWQSYQAHVTDRENLHNSAVMLDNARQSHEAARYRYQRGAGNIVELLNAQTVYAQASQQRIEAVRAWRTSRLQLAASVGRLMAPGL